MAPRKRGEENMRNKRHHPKTRGERLLINRALDTIRANRAGYAVPLRDLAEAHKLLYPTPQTL